MPVLALPDLSRHARLAALQKYRPFTPRRRAFVRAISAAIRLGVDRFLFSVTEDPLGDASQFDFRGWLEHLRAQMDLDVLATIVWPKQPDRNRLYVHLVDSRGRSVLFAKIALDAANAAPLLVESECVQVVNAKHPKSFRVPNFRTANRFSGNYFALYDPLPNDAKYIRPPDRVIAQWAEELGPTELIPSSELQNLKWWRKSVQSVVGMANEAFNRDLFKAEHTEVLVRPIHGDLGSNNIVFSGSDFWIFDWEEYERQGPAFVDQVSFYLSANGRRILRDPRAGARAFLDTFAHLDPMDLALAVAFLTRNRINPAIALSRAWQ